MPLTLGTIVGNVNLVNDNSILCVQVERAGKLTITANFAKNVTSGYVVAEVPENLEQLISETIVKEEYENVWFYVEEIKEWNEKERRKLEEYELEQGIREEDVRKDPIELIFDALRDKDHEVGALRTSYRNKKWTSLRTTWLLKMLEQEGLSGEYFQEDIKAMLENGELLDEEGAWKILKEQLGVKVPTSKPPEIEIKEVPPLLEELESIVSAAYNGVSLEEINLTQQVWDATGINLQEVYNKVNEGVRRLNSQYMLVKVVANSNDNVDNLTLVELGTDQKSGLKQNVPKQLRSYFRRPADIAYDAYVLSLLLDHIIHNDLSTYEEAVSVLNSEKAVFMERVIFEKIVGRKTSLIANVYPNLDDVSINEEETKKYRSLANILNRGIKKALLNGNVIYKSTNITFQLTELIDTIRYLIDFVPEELYRLKNANDSVNWAKKNIATIKKIEGEGKRLNKYAMQQRDFAPKVLDNAIKERQRVVQYLGILREGSGNLQISMDTKEAFKRLSVYGINHTTIL